MKPIVFVGEAFGENEAVVGRPFVGWSGVELLRMLDEAGVITLTRDDNEFIYRFAREGKPQLVDAVWNMHPELYRTNVFNQRPVGNKIEEFCGLKPLGIPGYGPLTKAKYVRKEFEHELARLGDELLDIDPNLVVCLGNTPLWALANKTGISKLRGTTIHSTHIVSDFKLLPVYHPAAILRQWELRPTTVVDLSKAVYEREYPDIRRPKREVWIEPTVKDINAFFRQYCDGCPLLSVDIETAGTQITCMGFAPRPDLALVVPFHDPRKAGRNYWATKELEREVWGLIREVLENPRIHKVFQNGLYDIAFIWRSYGVRVFGAQHDTMLLHHALQPEALKGLGYLGSVYTDEGPWKEMREKTTTIKRDE